MRATVISASKRALGKGGWGDTSHLSLIARINEPPGMTGPTTITKPPAM
jgi:hypothetical protein